MNMAKASKGDKESALEILRVLCGVFEDESFADYSDDESESEWFDDDSKEHLRGLYDQLKSAMGKAPGGMRRVVWGFEVMTDPQNNILDESADYLKLHPNLHWIDAEPETPNV